MKVNFNMSNFQNTIFPDLNKSIDSINLAINRGYNLYVPTTFSYYNVLKQIQEENIELQTYLINVRDKINKLNQDLDNSLNEVELLLRNICNIEIKKRQNLVK